MITQSLSIYITKQSNFCHTTKICNKKNSPKNQKNMPSISNTPKLTTIATNISKSHFPYKPKTLQNTLKTLNTKTTNLSLPTKPPKKEPKNILLHPQKSISDFQEKMLFLDSIGIDLFSLIPIHPQLVSSVKADDIKNLVFFLRSAACLSSQDIRRVVSMCPEILSLKTSNIVPVLTFLVREANVNGNNLRHVIHRRPRLLVSDLETCLRPTLCFLKEVLGIQEICKHTYLLSCNVEKKFLPRIEYFRKMGLSEKEAIIIFKRFPPLFCYSIEENFEPKFEFFLVEMGRGLKEIVEFPQYFSFSLENRIKPRHRKCVEKGVFLSLPMMLKSSEERFLDRLEVCCGNSMPVRTSPLWGINYNYDGVL